MAVGQSGDRVVGLLERLSNAVGPPGAEEPVRAPSSVESQAAASLPRWYREGLVEYLSGTAAGAIAKRLPSDTELRETHDAAGARRAYEEAAAAVAELGRHYGETALLRWVKSGIPSSASRPAVNSK